MTQLPYNTSQQIAPNWKVIEKLGLYTQISDITQSDNSEITQCFGLYIRCSQFKEVAVLNQRMVKVLIYKNNIIDIFE